MGILRAIIIFQKAAESSPLQILPYSGSLLKIFIHFLFPLELKKLTIPAKLIRITICQGQLRPIHCFHLGLRIISKFILLFLDYTYTQGHPHEPEIVVTPYFDPFIEFCIPLLTISKSMPPFLTTNDLLFCSGSEKQIYAIFENSSAGVSKFDQSCPFIF